MLFVPEDFSVPDKLKTKEFRLRMLSVRDVVIDYDAVMSSIDHLQGVFGLRSRWPSKDLTFEQDLIDLGWHQKEYQKRTSFAYTVVSLDESICLGCMYIFPTTKKGFGCEVYMWVRESLYKKVLDNDLYDSVKRWMSEKWPFKKVAYPGREISWSEWDKIPSVG